MSNDRRTGLRRVVAELVHDIRTAPGIVVFAVAVGAVGPVAFIQRRGMLLLLIVAAFALAVANRRRLAVAVRRPAVWAGIPFIAWMGVSLAWSSTPEPEMLLSAAATLLVGALAANCSAPLAQPHADRIGDVFAITVGVLILLLFVDGVSAGDLSQLVPGRSFRDPNKLASVVSARGTVVLVVLLWLACGYIWWRTGRIWLAFLFVVAAGATVFVHDMKAAQLAFVIGLGAACLASAAPRVTIIGIWALTAAYFALAPWISLYLMTPDAAHRAGIDLPFSGLHRLGIWHYTATWISEAPIFGWGFGASRWVSSMGDTLVLPQAPKLVLRALTLHPHNAALQIWLELGAAGVLMFCGVLAGLARGTLAMVSDRRTAMVVASTIAAIIPFSAISFGVWQEWWLATQFMAIVLLIAFVPVWRLRS